jgi:hypothetical protein
MHPRISPAALAATCLLTISAGFFSVSAQTVIKSLERPDPATVTVPGMAFKPILSDIRRFDEYFYFHKPGISYERAFADLDQCRIYGLFQQLSVIPPDFLPLGGELISDPKPGFTYVQGGILDYYFTQQANEDNERATVRRCMAFKGYARYGTSRAIGKQLESGTETEKLARRALIASGPDPQDRVIDP